MPSLLVVGNPKRRVKHAPSPAQKRQRARFAAMARAGLFKKRPAKKSHRRAPSHSVSTRKTPIMEHHTARRASPVKHHRRARRNPVGGVSMRGLSGQLKTAAMGAAGALGIDILHGFAAPYLPASFASPVDATTGTMNYIYYFAKGAMAVLAGMGLKHAIGGAKAARVVDGSLTVTLHDAMKQFAGVNLTGVPLAMYPRGGSTLRGYNPGRLAAPRALTYGAGAMGMYPSASQREGVGR